MIRDVNQLETANKVLASFARDSRIERRRGGWYVCWERGGKPYAKRWMCRSRQDFYPVWSNRWGHGGTACTALSQLIRWLQKKPVLPMSSWWYWASGKIQLLPAFAVIVLREGGYPEHADCVLCDNRIDGGLDWWNLNGLSGPCCSHRSGCKQTLVHRQKNAT